MAEATSTGAINSGSFSFLTGLGTPVLLLMMLLMLVMPLPPFLLDMFFTFNIALAIIVLLVAVYAKRPLEFAAFPTVLLIATLLRLALNVASTRVVLLEGHAGPGAAGKVIQAFGEFVVGGSYAVGLVVFAILVIINFVVVTKGAGRISEVTARFTLDAMPGKQMAIDADLNAGLIGQEQALLRRTEISSEADFYGAMDGASKFVRGDAIAGILILFINIIGGFSVGVLQYDLSASVAAHNYVLLTIGDGLVAQLPSLLLSTAAAIIVTRVSDAQDMGQAVVAQLFGKPVVLYTTAALIGIMGVVPGMPNLVFLSIAGMLGAMGYLQTQQQASELLLVEEIEEPRPAPELRELSWDDVLPIDEIGLEVGYRLISLVDKNQGGELLSRIKGVRKKLSQELGFLVHAVHIRDNLSLAPNEYRITFHDVTVGQGEVYPGKELAINPGQLQGQLPGIAVKDPTFGLDAVWIELADRDEAQALGFTVVDSSTVLATHLSQLIKNHAYELIGQDSVQQLLDKLAKTSPRVVESLTPKTLGLGEITKVMQNLLEEGVPIRDTRTIAEALADHGQRSQDTDVLTSQTRIALGRTIFQTVSGVDNELPVVVLDSQLEQILQNAMQAGGGGLEPTLIENVFTQLASAAANMEAAGKVPVLLVSSKIRLFLSRLLKGRMSSLYILAYEEIPASKQLKVVATLGNRLLPQ
tara:strand:- start:34502 stop:36595 length:2094 start_codon:yes stop_codon:yes gene_type:complete